MRGRRGADGWLLLAAVVGVAHGLFSVYWSVGGDWLLATLGRRLVEQFADVRWLLAPVGIVKLGLALAPLWLAVRGWPAPRLTRPAAWLVALALALWGGLNTVIGQLVLAGVIRPDGGYDRLGMLGHAWLWDPLFLVWGVALLAHLRRTRRVRSAATP